MKFSAVTMYWLCNETNSRLNSLAERVKEGKDLEAALEFARYLLNSGLCDLLDAHKVEGALPVRSNAIRSKAEKLQRDVCLRYETRDTKPHVEESDLVQIRRELADLRAQIGAQSPPLRVIEGGNQ
jgi:hypothetical protein